MAAAIAAHEQELVLLCGGTSALFDTAAVDWRIRFTRDDHGIVQVLRVLPSGRAYDR